MAASAARQTTAGRSHRMVRSAAADKEPTIRRFIGRSPFSNIVRTVLLEAQPCPFYDDRRDLALTRCWTAMEMDLSWRGSVLASASRPPSAPRQGTTDRVRTQPSPGPVLGFWVSLVRLAASNSGVAGSRVFL